MSTIEKVAEELRNLNNTADLSAELLVDGIAHLESSHEKTVGQLSTINRQLIAIQEVLERFMNQVPDKIVSGFEKVIVTDQLREERVETNNKVQEDREKASAPVESNEKAKGFISGNFQKGREDLLGGGMFGGIKDFAAEAIQVAGTITAIVQKGAALLLGGLKMLAVPLKAMFGVITTPAALIAAAIGGLVMGIQNFIEDFKGAEGTLTDKVISGLFGFLDGFMKLITIPLDFLKDILAKGLELFGFDNLAEKLDGFSFTGALDQLTDSIRDFILGLKDLVVDKVKGFFGIDTSEDGREADRLERENELIRERIEVENTEATTTREKNVKRNRLIAINKELSEIQEERGFDSTREARKEFAAEGLKGDGEEIMARRQQESAAIQQRDAIAAVEPQGQTRTRRDVQSSESSLVASSETSERREFLVVARGPEKVGQGTMQSALQPVPTESESLIVAPAGATVVGGTQQNVALSEQMSVANTKMMNNRATSTSTGGGSQAVVVADNSVNSNTTNVKSSGMTSPLDKADRSHRLGYRGRRV